jgi:serine/threonine protein kinase
LKLGNLLNLRMLMELLDGKYRIEQLLGEGGMGAVYRATHIGTKRTVAVKVIHPQFSAHHEFVARFQREAEAAGRLQHPNVVDVTDFGFAQTERGRVAYLVMEYLHGATLAEIIQEEGRLPTSWGIDILEQVCAAVEEAHRAGIIHRDLKPDNIWLEPNGRGGYTVKVLDFGLVKLTEGSFTTETQRAQSEHREEPISGENQPLLRPGDEPATIIRPAGKLVETNDDWTRRFTLTSDSNGHQSSTATDESLTVMGRVMGTPSYMSPEQCRGETLDARSDIYSLGVVAYRLLAGEAPFAGTPDELIELHKTAEPMPLREKNRKVPKKLAHVVMTALEKNPADRPQTAAGFASALRAAGEGVGHLLRQAFALYSEHFPTFIKISLLGYAPLIVVLAVISVLDKLINPNTSQGLLLYAGIISLIAMLLAMLFAYFSVSAATVPVVVQLMIAALKAVHIKEALTAVIRRWRVFALTSLIVMTSILFGSILFVLPGLVLAVLFALYAPVAIMEQHGVWATLRRSRKLSRKARGSVVVITVLQFALPILVWRIAVKTDVTLKLNDDFSPKEFGFNVSTSGQSAFYQLLNVFVTPLTTIMISLLYMKTRKAGGESLQDAIARFEAGDLPRSRWQAKMRTRPKEVDPQITQIQLTESV